MSAAAGATPWTPQQRAAIEDRGRDLIVAAAAGSGKTAVLAERVFRLVAAGGDLERMLVITFTRKAAREMRERIEGRILKGLSDDPASAPLRRALDALPLASIMTIDAFCDRLVRRHFARARVSPAVGLAGEDEEREIEQAAARLQFEELARDAGPEGEAFALLARAAHPTRRERDAFAALASRVHRIRRFLLSLDNDEAWVARARASFASSGPFDCAAIGPAFARSMTDLAGGLDHLAAQARARFGAEGAEQLSALCLGASAALADFAGRAQAAAPAELEAVWSAAAAWKDSPEAKPLESLKTQRVCGKTPFDDKPFANARLTPMASRWNAWKRQWFPLSAEHAANAARVSAEMARALLDLALRVEARVQQMKRRRGVLGFSDMARRALAILTDPAGPGPSDIAQEYQRHFEWVLVDEYQDVSPLQDALIRRISREGDPQPGAERNLFVVGDIKQSIYRFRRADPALFRRRFDASPAEPGPADPNKRIQLTANFRSRPGILDCVNAVFERAMDRAIGDLDYDAEARLAPGRAEAPGCDPVCVEAVWIEKKARAAPGAGAPDDANADAESDPPGEERDKTGAGEDGEGEAGAEFEAAELEARWIAARIKELTNPETGLLIPDEKADGGRRRARPGDCAILVRRLKAEAPRWTRTLGRFGLRAQAGPEESFLDSPDLSDLIAALRLADNPFQDIPLAAALRSPLFGLTEDELFEVRRARLGVPFHEAFWRAAGRGVAFPDGEPAHPRRGEAEAGPETRARAARAMETILGWGEAARRGTAEDVLAAILAETDCAACLAGGPEAEAKLARLEELRKALASRAERGGEPASLSDFIRALDERGDDARGPEEADAAGDPGAVHLLTIHKSKGLEFPIVFLARLSAKFEGGARDAGLELSAENGMAVMAADPDRRLRLMTPALAALRAEEARGARAEELRLLYVAMTRARERLILVASEKLAGLEAKFGASAAAFGERIPALDRLALTSPLALLGPLLQRMQREFGNPAWLWLRSAEEVPASPPALALPKTLEALAGAGEPAAAWNEARAEFAARFPGAPREWETPRAAAPSLPELILPPAPGALSSAPAKTMASGRKGARPGAASRADKNELELFGAPDRAYEAREFRLGRAARAPEEPLPVPDFIEAERAARSSGAERGTLVHRLMQHADLRGDLTAAGLRAQAEKLRESGLFNLPRGGGGLDAIPYEAVAKFFESDLGRRIRARPGSVLREIPFTLAIPAREYFEWMGAAEAPAAEEAEAKLLLQGMIDAAIDEGGAVTLIDYKTDRAENAERIEELKRIYAPQLAAYRRALESAWGVNVKETWLAFIEAGENALLEAAASGAPPASSAMNLAEGSSKRTNGPL